MSLEENNRTFAHDTVENPPILEDTPPMEGENDGLVVGQTVETKEGTFIYAGLYPPQEEPLPAPKPKPYSKSFAIYIAMLCFFCSLLAGALGVFIGLKMANTSLTLDAMIDRIQANADKGVTGNTVAEVASSVISCGVTVQVSEDNANIAGTSSGVCIAQEGSNTYIACCYHAIAGYPHIRVKDDTGNLYTAQLVGFDYMTDLALLKISATGLKIAVPTASAAIVGQTAIIVGAPLGSVGNCVSVGFVSRSECQVMLNGIATSVMKLDAALNPGNSGGGVFDTNGHLLGIVCAKVSESDGVAMEGLGFAIPASAAYPILNDLLDRGFVSGRADLGIVFKDATSQADGLTVDEYLFPEELQNGEVLQEGDVIVALKPISSLSYVNLAVSSEQTHGQAKMKLHKTLATLNEGDAVALGIQRAGTSYTVYVSITVKATQ